jgi:hypothetical protein
MFRVRRCGGNGENAGEGSLCKQSIPRMVPEPARPCRFYKLKGQENKLRYVISYVYCVKYTAICHLLASLEILTRVYSRT